MMAQYTVTIDGKVFKNYGSDLREANRIANLWSANGHEVIIRMEMYSPKNGWEIVREISPY